MGSTWQTFAMRGPGILMRRCTDGWVVESKCRLLRYTLLVFLTVDWST